MSATTTRFTLVLVTLCLFALVIAGCGGGDGGETGTESTGSAAGAGEGSGEGSGETAAPAPAGKTCNDHKALSLCGEHGPEAIAAISEGFYKDFCELGEGVWGTEPCPADNRLATCDDGAGNIKHYYTDGGEPWDKARAEADCKELMGKLTVH